MAFRARDGRAFGNRQKMKAYDERTASQRQERGDSLESKPDQESEELETQDRDGRTNDRRGDPTPPRSYKLNPRREGGNPDNPGKKKGATNVDSYGDNPGPQENPEGAGGDISHMDINEAVRQHGPAEHIEIRHSGASHQVTSRHGGRTHRSVHPTPHAAHMHAADAAGLNPENAGTGPDMGGQDQMMPMPIPGLQQA